MQHPDDMDNSRTLADITFRGVNSHIRYQLGAADISVVPMSMVTEGIYEGCYDNLRIWLNTSKSDMERLLGYVRIVFHEVNVPLVYYRRTWADEWHLFGAPKSNLAQVLLTAYSILYEMSEMREELDVPVSDPSTGYHLLLDE